MRIIQGLDLSGRVLKGVDWEGADVIDVKLTEVDFEGANLKGVKFERVFAERANFRGANLEGALLSGDFSEADFTAADLTEAQFVHAILLRATLERAKAPRSSWRNSDAHHVNCRFADFTGAEFHCMYWNDSDFQGADLLRVEAKGVVWDRVSLHRAKNSHHLVEQEQRFVSGMLEGLGSSHPELLEALRR